MKINFDIELTPSQRLAYRLAHDKETRFIVLCWSRQSGKSMLMKVLCIEWLFSKQRQEIGYVCKNYILAKKLFRDITQYVPKQLIKSSNGSDLQIISENGSTLTFYSAESGASLRGQTFTKLIMDEFAFFQFEQTDGSDLWNNILYPTIKIKGDKIIFVSTPLGMENPFYTMYERGLSDEFPQYKSMLKTIYDDGLVKKEEIEEIKKSIPDISFRQEFLCEFISDGTSFFKNFDSAFKTDFIYNEDRRQWIGIDLSANGEDNTILTKINEDFQIKQYEISGTLDEKYFETARIINETKYLQGTYIEQNGIGAPMMNEIKKKVNHPNRIFEWTTINRTKIEICSELAMAFANNILEIDRNDTKLYKELSNFKSHFSKSGTMKLEGESNTHDDRVMSLAIALRAKESTVTFTKNNYSFTQTKNRSII